MTSKEFVIWLQGFVAASHKYNITPAQWDEIKDKLETIVDTPNESTPRPSEKIF
jgi:hypothetical protein